MFSDMYVRLVTYRPRGRFERLRLILPSSTETPSDLYKVEATKSLHFDQSVSPSAYNFIGHKVDAIDLVSMPRKVDFDFIRLEIPYILIKIVSMK